MARLRSRRKIRLRTRKMRRLNNAAQKIHGGQLGASQWKTFNAPAKGLPELPTISR